MKNSTVLISGLLAGLCLATAAKAAPIAPYPPPGNPAKAAPCPEAGLVGIPAYPGAYCVEYTPYKAYKKGDMLPIVDLISKAPPEKVEQWYAEHLKGWQQSNGFFTPPGWSRSRFPFERHVMVEKASDYQNFSVYQNDYNLSGIQTHIEIRFAPREEQ